MHEENLRVVQKYFGLFPPLSLAWAAAIAREAGHEVMIVDARTLYLSMDQVLEKLVEFKAEIMGFMMTTYMFPDTLQWIKFLKAGLHIPVVVGGYNLRIYPRASLSHPEINFGILEHALDTLPGLLASLEGRSEFKDVPGLIYKENHEIKINPTQPVDFEKFPHPARDLLPNELYAEFLTERRNFTVMVTSLGCPFGCSFCEAGRTCFNPRSPKTVVNEMEECYHQYNIREIDIFDYNFTAEPQRTIAICREIRRRKLDLLWACRSRVDLDLNLLQEMKAAGCGRIYYGLESGCQTILDQVNKGISLDQIRHTIKMTQQCKIKALGFFLIGAPGDTLESIKTTVKFAKSLNLDFVQFSKCLAKPSTPLWMQMKAQTGRDYWEDWILGLAEDQSLPRPWTKLSNSQIDQLTKWAYVNFHSRFLFLLKSTLKVRSLKEFRRKVFGYLEMIFSQEKTAVLDHDFSAYNENK